MREHRFTWVKHGLNMGYGIATNSTAFLYKSAVSVQRNLHCSGIINADQNNIYMVILTLNKT